MATMCVPFGSRPEPANRYLEKMRVKYRDFYGPRSIIGFMMAVVMGGMAASIESSERGRQVDLAGRGSFIYII